VVLELCKHGRPIDRQTIQADTAVVAFDVGTELYSILLKSSVIRSIRPTTLSSTKLDNPSAGRTRPESEPNTGVTAIRSPSDVSRLEVRQTDGRRRRVDDRRLAVDWAVGDRHLSCLRPSVWLSSSHDPYVAQLAFS